MTKLGLNKELASIGMQLVRTQRYRDKTGSFYGQEGWLRQLGAVTSGGATALPGKRIYFRAHTRTALYDKILRWARITGGETDD